MLQVAGTNTKQRRTLTDIHRGVARILSTYGRNQRFGGLSAREGSLSCGVAGDGADIETDDVVDVKEGTVDVVDLREAIDFAFSGGLLVVCECEGGGEDFLSCKELEPPTSGELLSLRRA